MKIIHIAFLTILAIMLTACGGSSSQSSTKKPETVKEGLPLNTISHAYFRDQDGSRGLLGGNVTLTINATAEIPQDKIESIWVYWADAQGNKIQSSSEPFLKTPTDSVFDINIPTGTAIPSSLSSNEQALILYPNNAQGEATVGTVIKFHDFISNAQLSGPGGNYQQGWSWYYGIQPADQEPQFTKQRNTIPIQRTESGQCIFDNGLVSITDMNYGRDIAWENRSDPGQANIADDILYPAYSYRCDENPINTHRYIDDEDGVWTYSTLNDGMFYGTLAYDMFVKYLGEPPLNEKIRIRAHYEQEFFKGIRSQAAYWDGAYANFGDGYVFEASMLTLDSVSHEIGHGVLNRLMGLSYLQENMSHNIKTYHEAFGDISGVVAWYELTGDSDNYWRHDEENGGAYRQVNAIKTTNSAIESYLDYRPEDPDFYASIGMITYPFYLLSQKWGIEKAYHVLINSTRNCITATQSFSEIAQCIKQQTELTFPATNLPNIDITPRNQKVDDVIAAFKTVKIKLFDDGVLSHFFAPQAIDRNNALTVKFIDDSRSTGEITQWLWEFGDGQTSTQQHPVHTYTEAKNYTVKLTVKNSVYNANNNAAENDLMAPNHKDDFSRIVKIKESEN